MRRFALMLTLAAAFLAEPAHAGDAAAEALFRAGRDAFAAGDFRTACARFEESQRLEPAVGTVINLAQCHEQLGQVASAWRRYREAQDRLTAGDERLELVKLRLAAIEPRLPKLSLRLGQPSPGAAVVRDGVELGEASLGVAVPVDPGKHEVTVSAPGHATRSIEVELRESESKELVVEIGPPLATAPPSAAPRPTLGPDAGTRDETRRTMGYVVGGVGVGALAASLITGALVLDKKAVVEDECSGKLCSAEGVEAGESGRTFSTISTIAFAAGAAGIGVGAYLLLSADDAPEQAHVEVRALPGAAALRFGTRF